MYIICIIIGGFIIRIFCFITYLDCLNFLLKEDGLATVHERVIKINYFQNVVLRRSAVESQNTNAKELPKKIIVSFPTRDTTSPTKADIKLCDWCHWLDIENGSWYVLSFWKAEQ